VSKTAAQLFAATHVLAWEKSAVVPNEDAGLWTLLTVDEYVLGLVQEDPRMIFNEVRDIDPRDLVGLVSETVGYPVALYELEPNRTYTVTAAEAMKAVA
jgi:hypothetical protein